jgi:hypothetical protein
MNHLLKSGYADVEDLRINPIATNRIRNRKLPKSV